MPWTYQSSKDGFTINDIPDDIKLGSPEFVYLVSTMRGKSDSIATANAGEAPPPEPTPSDERGILERAKAVVGDLAPGIIRGVAPIATGAAMGAAMGAPFAGVGAAPGAAVGAGLVAGATLVGDPAAQIINSLAGEQVVTAPTEVINNVLDQMGIPRPETSTGRMAQAAAQGVGGAAGMVGAGRALSGAASPVLAAVGRGLAANVPAQIVGGATGGLAAQGAAELGGGPITQLGAGLLGGMGGGMAAGRVFALPHPIDHATGLQMAPATAQRVVAMREAQARGIPVHTSDVFPPQTWPAKFAKTVLDKMPFATSGMNAKQAAARQAAVDDFVGSIGARGEVGESIGKATENLLKSRQSELSKNLANKADVMARADGAGPVNVAATTAEIDRQIANLRGMRNAEVEPAIAQLENVKKSIENQPLLYVEANRKALGDKLKDAQVGEVVKTNLQKAADAIYRILNQDMRAHIEGALGPQDATRWAVANKRISGMMEEIDATRGRDVLAVVRRGAADPAKLQKVLFSGTPSDIRTAYKYMDADGRAAARRAYVDRAIDVATGGRGLNAADPMSVDKFKNALQVSIKNAGPFMAGADGDHVRGLIKALDLTVGGTRANQIAQTGAMNAPILIGGGVLSGDAFGAAKALGGIGLASLLARGYESPAVRDALVKLARTKSGSSAEYGAINRLMVQASVLANEEERKKKGAKK